MVKQQRRGKIQTVPFPLVAARIKRYWNPYEYNPHKGLLAPTRCGKSYLIRHGLLPIVPGGRVIVIDVKPGGERTWNGWGNDVDALSHGFGRGNDGTANYRIMLQPDESGKAQILRVLEMVAAEGECILIMDDSRKLTAHMPGLGLSGHVDGLLNESAAIGVSVIIAANSTVWATSTLRDQCGMYFVGLMSNETERNKFAQIIGLDRDKRRVLSSLKQRQFLYSDHFDGEMRIALTGLE